MARPQSIRSKLEQAIDTLSEAMQGDNSRKQLSAQTVVETYRSLWLQEAANEESEAKRSHERAKDESLLVADGLKALGLTLDDVKQLQARVAELERELQNGSPQMAALEARKKAEKEIEQAADALREMKTRLEKAEDDSLARWRPWFELVDTIPHVVLMEAVFKVCQRLQWEGVDELLRAVDRSEWPAWYREFKQALESVHAGFESILNAWSYIGQYAHTLVEEDVDVLSRGDVIGARSAAMEARGETVVRWRDVANDRKLELAFLIVGKLGEAKETTRGVGQWNAQVVREY